MNTQITPFAFGENLLRTITDEHGNPWFVAKDVALALNYEWNGSARIAHVPEEWRGVTSVVTPFGIQEMLTLSEQGLYFFLGRSDKPKALPYQKWIAGDVMPSIMRTGSYTMPTASRQAKRRSMPTALDFDSLPADIQSLPQKIREKSLNYTMQTMRTLGIASKDELRETFIDYCRTIGDDSAVPAHDKVSKHADEQDFIHEYIKTCLVPEASSKLSLEKVYDAFVLWWKGRFTVFCPSSMAFGRVLSRYYYRRKSNKMIYHGLAFAHSE